MTHKPKNSSSEWFQVVGVGLTTKQAAELRTAIVKKLKTDPLHTTSVLPKK